MPPKFTRRNSLEESQLSYLRQLSTSAFPDDISTDNKGESQGKPTRQLSKSLHKLNNAEAVHSREPPADVNLLRSQSKERQKRSHVSERDSVIQRSVDDELKKGELEAKKSKQKKSKETQTTTIQADVFY